VRKHHARQERLNSGPFPVSTPQRGGFSTIESGGDVAKKKGLVVCQKTEDQGGEKKEEVSGRKPGRRFVWWGKASQLTWGPMKKKGHSCDKRV